MRTGDKRPNLEVVSEKEPSHLGLLPGTGMGSEGRVGKVGRDPGVREGKPQKESVLGTLEGSPWWKRAEGGLVWVTNFRNEVILVTVGHGQSLCKG